jgi:hypothetical protein
MVGGNSTRFDVYNFTTSLRRVQGSTIALAFPDDKFCNVYSTISMLNYYCII